MAGSDDDLGALAGPSKAEATTADRHHEFVERDGAILGHTWSNPNGNLVIAHGRAHHDVG
jgi:hypothetical protein